MVLPKRTSSGISISSRVYMHRVSAAPAIAQSSSAAGGLLLDRVPYAAGNRLHTNVEGLVLHDDGAG